MQISDTYELERSWEPQPLLAATKYEQNKAEKRNLKMQETIK